MVTTSAVRQRLREQRDGLDPAVARIRSETLCQHLISSPVWDDAPSIAGYLAIGGEADPTSILQQGHRDHRNIYVPVVTGDQLVFAPWHPGCPTLPNRYGIAEPVHEITERRSPEHFDLVLVPLVAVDSDGNRIGMGAGYYDRAFAFMNQNPRPARPVLVGIAYDLQRIDTIARQAWDVPLDAVVTESGWSDFRKT